MLRNTLLVTSVLGGLLFAFTADGHSTSDPVSIAPGFSTKQEPVLIYDVTGSTIAGPIHTNLVVYNNGVVSLARSVSFLGTGTVEQAFLSAADATKLLTDLAQAGAFKLQDNPQFATDSPVTTVTVMRGATDSRSHTFSFLVGSGQHGTVQGIILDFINDNFPNS